VVTATDDELLRFANAFDGYTIWGGVLPVQTVTYSVEERWRHDRQLPSSLTMLRTALFGEARSERFVDYGGFSDSDEGWNEHRTYMRLLLERIELCLADGDRDEENATALRWLQSHAPRDVEADVENDPPATADEDIAAAVELAARMLALDLCDRVPASETRMREHLVTSLRHTSGATVVAERHVPIPEFQGVGPVDIIVRAQSGGPLTGLVECKLSRDRTRDKIFEGAWDAIKLALATRSSPSATAYLVTGATGAVWTESETGDLFVTGEVETRELWHRRLDPPGPNGGHTVGADCEAGGRGNMFTHAPERLQIRLIADVAVPGTDLMIKACRLCADGNLIRFADEPEFPQVIGANWLQAHVPSMPEDQFQRLLGRLRAKRWTEQELSDRVLHLRNPKE